MVSMRAADYKAPGGKLVRVRLAESEGKIASVRISGDFFLVPEDNLSILERMLEGSPIREAEVRLAVNRFFDTTRSRGLGVSLEDFVSAVLLAKEEAVVV